jgi:hypothetical protein
MPEDEMMVQQQKIGEGVEALSSTPSKLDSEGERDSEKEKDDVAMSTPEEVKLKGEALLKSLLTKSIAPTDPVVEKMITTTEVTDETLNLKKILYQPDREKKDDKEQDSPTLNGHPANTIDSQIDDDDRRLVIDISDEEKDGFPKMNGNSMPSLNTSIPDEHFATRRTRPTTLEVATCSSMPYIVRQPARVQESKSHRFH